MFGRTTLVTSAAFAGSLLASVSAYAADTIKPAVLYDLGGKFDKSFNEGVFNGATKFKKETGVDFRDLEIQNESQREQVLRKFAKDGFSPIMTVGFAWETALKKIAPEYPKTKFGIIDDVVDLPNVQSVVFKEHEGSFVVGVIAADTSKTGKVGFVGGMDIPLISKFECGYAQGVKYGSDGKAEVFSPPPRPMRPTRLSPPFFMTLAASSTNHSMKACSTARQSSRRRQASISVISRSRTSRSASRSCANSPRTASRPS